VCGNCHEEFLPEGARIARGIGLPTDAEFFKSLVEFAKSFDDKETAA